jgi:hypothetical protein
MPSKSGSFLSHIAFFVPNIVRYDFLEDELTKEKKENYSNKAVSMFFV